MLGCKSSNNNALKRADLEMSKPPKRRRALGGGRRKLTDLDDRLLDDLRRLVGLNAAGTLQPTLAWTCKSTSRLAAELQRLGHAVSQRSVHGILSELCFDLNSVGRTPHTPSDRAAQIRFISRMVENYCHAGFATVSLRIRHRESDNKRNDEDIVDWNDCNADSSASDASCILLAIELLRSWWRGIGSRRHFGCNTLLLVVDARGGTARRIGHWKDHLRRLASECDLTIGVCHLPPGSFRWHRKELAMACDTAWGKGPTELLCVELCLLGSRPSPGFDHPGQTTRSSPNDQRRWSYEVRPQRASK